MFRHGFAIQTLQATLKDKDWESARVYLDSTENFLAPESRLFFADSSLTPRA